MGITTIFEDTLKVGNIGDDHYIRLMSINEYCLEYRMPVEQYVELTRRTQVFCGLIHGTWRLFKNNLDYEVELVV